MLRSGPSPEMASGLAEVKMNLSLYHSASLKQPHSIQGSFPGLPSFFFHSAHSMVSFWLPKPSTMAWIRKGERVPALTWSRCAYNCAPWQHAKGNSNEVYRFQKPS